MIAEFVYTGEPALSGDPAPGRPSSRRQSIPAATAMLFAILVAMLFGCAGDYSVSAPPPAPDSVARNGLWTASAATPTILRFSQSQLGRSGDRSPATQIFTSSAELFNLNGVAFDVDGKLWVTSQDDSVLVAFAPGALTGSGFSLATIRIKSTAGSLSEPVALAFDAQHRLWVANFSNGTIVAFDQSSLASSGAPTPAVIISGLGHPSALAFDASGSVWVSDGRANTVSSFTAAQLAASGSPAPHVVLSANAGSLLSPAGVAFDAHGNLWVASTANQTVVSFSPEQLTATASPIPHTVLSTNAGSLLIPSGLAFDADGSLWVMGGGGALEKFSGSLLAATGSPPPSVRIAVQGFVLFWSVAFWPKPSGLPLN